MKLVLVFPDLNRFKSYKSDKRKFNLYVNTDEQKYTIDMNSALNGEIDVKFGDNIFVEKRFGFSKKRDSSFYYKVGQDTAELTNQQGKKKNVPVNIDDGVLHILDDNDFKKAIHVAKSKTSIWNR